MTPQQDYAKDIERLLIDCKRRLNEAADRGQIVEVSRLSDQITSLSRMLELVA
jgi:hypothetical protein